MRVCVYMCMYLNFKCCSIIRLLCLASSCIVCAYHVCLSYNVHIILAVCAKLIYYATAVTDWLALFIILISHRSLVSTLLLIIDIQVLLQ